MADHTMDFTCRCDDWVAVFASRHPLLTRSTWGRCDHGSKTIVIRGSLKGVTAIDTAVHEFTHAYFPDLAEDSVNEFATQLVEFLRAANMIDEDWSRKDLE